ncbi:UDP-glucose:undecaprenyl-phosphate glucose-1-phosphate transferase [Arenibacter sp. NBRC 103722]|uniref:sugar transferase n=1 Tax=Arenibacter sp. NBRC 103722 TaxID=1113929 RepID=UPI000852F01A|nr:sugar transferase [Arenibacter sp. NBRC 103722]GBF20066.1 UDP-glucose:undecaprenyl-phosphate glucose-1-phosphate transferase [Arenibacter sp. NBRC 103722]
MLKRSFDILSSGLGLLLISPILLIVSLAITLSSKGGVFYKQSRVGLNGVNFNILKFRTMFTGSDKKGLLTVGDRDPRVTPIGYYLRKYKLDELPQLINVLIGDMSLVGPRPEVSKYVNLYSKEDRVVLSIKPGITDYASIYFRNENEILNSSSNPEKKYIEEVMPLKLELNKKYIKEKGLLTDVKIIFMTLKSIFHKNENSVT